MDENYSKINKLYVAISFSFYTTALSISNDNCVKLIITKIFSDFLFSENLKSSWSFFTVKIFVYKLRNVQNIYTYI